MFCVYPGPRKCDGFRPLHVINLSCSVHVVSTPGFVIPCQRFGFHLPKFSMKFMIVQFVISSDHSVKPIGLLDLAADSDSSLVYGQGSGVRF